MCCMASWFWLSVWALGCTLGCCSTRQDGAWRVDSDYESGPRQGPSSRDHGVAHDYPVPEALGCTLGCCSTRQDKTVHDMWVPIMSLGPVRDQAVGTMGWHMTTLSRRALALPWAAAQQDKTRQGPFFYFLPLYWCMFSFLQVHDSQREVAQLTKQLGSATQECQDLSQAPAAAAPTSGTPTAGLLDPKGDGSLNEASFVKAKQIWLA